MREALLAAEAELTGGQAQGNPLRRRARYGALLQRAACPAVGDTETYTVLDSLFGLIRDLRAMGMTNPLASRNRKPMPRRFFLRAAEIYAQPFLLDPDGRIRRDLLDHYLSAGRRTRVSRSRSNPARRSRDCPTRLARASTNSRMTASRDLSS